MSRYPIRNTADLTHYQAGGTAETTETAIQALQAEAHNYEVGTWTPQLKFGGASVDMTGTFTGRRTYIGNRVLFDINIVLTAKGSSTGDATIDLPIASGGSGGGGLLMDVVTPGAGLVPHWSIVAAATTIALRTLNLSTGANASMTDAQFADTSVIRLSGNYSV